MYLSWGSRLIPLRRTRFTISVSPFSRRCGGNHPAPLWSPCLALSGLQSLKGWAESLQMMLTLKLLPMGSLYGQHGSFAHPDRSVYCRLHLY